MELNPLKESNDEYKYYELFIGPNHPGIEGNFSYVLKMKGHSVVEVTPDPGLLHRGFEKLMERRLWTQNLALIPRICVPEPDVNEVAYCMGIEHMMKIEVPKRAQYIRVIVLELARIASLLFGISGLGGTTGHYTTVQWLVGDRDYILDLFEWLTGGRVYHIYQYPGGVKILRQCVKQIPDGPHKTKVPNPFQFRVPKGSFYSKVESSRGEFGYYIVSDGDVKPYRIYVRGPSYSIGLHYATKALVGMRIEDVPVWIHTTDMCPPDFDR